MEMKNLICKLAGKKEAFTTMEEKTNFWNFVQKAYIKGVLYILNEIIDSLEEITGIKLEEQPEHRMVIDIEKQRKAR